ncbi:MAG: hypothetical protein V9F00_09195 [Nocardioides sp.]
MHLRSTPTFTSATRRLLASTALTFGLLAGTSGCALTGFHDATTRDYTAANGVNVDEPTNDIAIIGTVVVSAEDGTGTLVGNLANKTDEPIALMSVKGVPGNTTVTSSEFAPITVPGRAGVPLAGGDVEGIRLIGDFAAGDFLKLTLAFDNGDQILVNAPVAADDHAFDGFDNAPAPETTP